MFTLTWRNLLARKVRLLMSALAIVLGMGFLTGVLTFSSGLSKTFDGIIEGSTPDASVRPEGSDSFSAMGAGNDRTVTPADVAKIAALPEVAAADGSVDGLGLYVLNDKGKLVGTGGAPTLAFNYTNTKNLLGQTMLELDGGAWPAADDEIALDTAAAKNAGYEIGDEVTVIPPGVGADGQPLTQKLKLVGLAGFAGGSGTAGSTLVIFDTHGAQKMFLGGQDVFTSVMLTAADGVSQSQLVKAVNAVTPDGYEAVAGDKIVKESQSAIGQFLGFITYFLGAFAVIAVIVGGFIIANTFSILVAQRVRELALVRALGASKKQVRRSVLLEALLMAVIGTSIGLLVGLGLARGLAALFNSFGLKINSSVLNLTAGTIITAYVVGILVTVLSAYFPARKAAKVAPVAAMREDSGLAEGSLRRRTIIGAVMLVIGAVFAGIGLTGVSKAAAWIGAGAVTWVITVAAIAAVIGLPVLIACRSLFGRVFGTTGRLAGDNAIRNPRRTGATASALMIGLALVSAVGVLAASMNSSMQKVVDDQFASDFLVQSPVYGSFPVALGTEMSKVDGVGVVSRQQAAVARLDGETSPSYIIGADQAFTDVYKLTMVEGADKLGGSDALLNESTAKKLKLGVGDTLKLDFPGAANMPITVTGVFEDTPVAGDINVGFDVFKRAGIKRVDNSLSINVADGADVGAVHKKLDALIEDLPIVAVQDKRQFAESLSAQINQLLYLVYGLLALSVVIAVIGIVNTLSLSVIERTREIGLLRAVGLSRKRLRRMITLESVTISVMGGVLGLALGLLIGILLRQSLSDDLTELAIPWSSLVLFLVLAVIFGVIAAVVPAIRASRMKVLDAIATE